MLAIISDVHGNIEALEVVLSDIKKKGIKDIIFLGDAVGYGPDPEVVLKVLKKECLLMIAGNHDRAVIDPSLEGYFNENAREAIKWTRSILSKSSTELLRSLPLTARYLHQEHAILAVHSSPKEPEQWHYILTLSEALMNFYYFAEKFCFIGHSHIPFIVEKSEEGELLIRTDRPCTIKDNCRYIINAGSVGQPRDGDPRSCYVIFNSYSIDFVRLPYDIHRTQKKMREAGLPSPLIYRLEKGV